MEAIVNLKLSVAELNMIVLALNFTISEEATYRKMGDMSAESRKESFAREAQLAAIRDKLK
jgi:hypothetical protein